MGVSNRETGDLINPHTRSISIHSHGKALSSNTGLGWYGSFVLYWTALVQYNVQGTSTLSQQTCAKVSIKGTPSVPVPCITTSKRYIGHNGVDPRRSFRATSGWVTSMNTCSSVVVLCSLSCSHTERVYTGTRAFAVLNPLLSYEASQMRRTRQPEHGNSGEIA